MFVGSNVTRCNFQHCAVIICTYVPSLSFSFMAGKKNFSQLIIMLLTTSICETEAVCAVFCHKTECEFIALLEQESVSDVEQLCGQRHVPASRYRCISLTVHSQGLARLGQPVRSAASRTGVALSKMPASPCLLVSWSHLQEVGALSCDTQHVLW